MSALSDHLWLRPSRLLSVFAHWQLFMMERHNLGVLTMEDWFMLFSATLISVKRLVVDFEEAS